ncbi:MAG TPA: serpin family protein [Dongiaceae bacterium]|nr:serpin family protein [Dongiaceae bacterium]
MAQLATANNTFAFRLLTQLTAKSPGTNIFVSPYSAATALQMALNGAAGETKTEMQNALATSDISLQQLNAANQAAAKLIDSHDTNIILTVANALWYRQSARVQPGFLDANQKFFSSTIKPLDFGNVKVAEDTINQWASDQTHGRITGIANGMIDPTYTDLILANAIYFKGAWLDPFNPKKTKDRLFHPAIGAERAVPMMELSQRFYYRKGPNYQAVWLSYLGFGVGMYVFLPDADSSTTLLLDHLNGQYWQQEIVSGFNLNLGSLVLPRFRVENTLELKAPLQALGMETAFKPGKADFSGMFADPHSISAVRQKTFIAVDEKGTEAAAATAIGMVALSAETHPPKPFEMIVDRPFLFVIADAQSGMILFVGVVNTL